MSILSDLAIKKLAMRKEAGSPKFTAPKYAFLYERAGYPYGTDDYVEGTPKYEPETITYARSPYAEHITDLILNRLRLNPIKPGEAVVPSRTGYTDHRDITATIYNAMANDIPAEDTLKTMRQWFNPYASKLAYPGSYQQKLDKRFENYQKAK